MATADNENINTNTDEVTSQVEVEKVEEQPINVSKFEYIKIAKQTTSTVVLEWKYNEDKDEDLDNPEKPEKVFKIVKLKNRNEWETISWTRKSICVMENLGLNLDDKRSRQELEEIAEAFNNLARYASLKSVLAPLERDPTKKIADMFDEHLTGAYERLPEWAKWRKESESSDTHTGEHDENL